ncbi:MAG: 16S rRNA (uracil(1498)-N(3))-methyltransferase [Bacteroidales bacterium]|jgi:16S rRNA (uracil1498-N3)-methyltransferase|nr:16S rRNA (uracil(1498)-N(3))-methyltransferase [Bacteroidales bacterium]
MQVFYSPDISGNSFTLDKNESKHIIRVLRMKKGTPVNLIDGKGNLFKGIISIPDPAGCIIDIESVVHEFEKRNYWLHIAISPLKNTERLDWFIEKAVEIGIDEITPIICRNTEKPGIKYERTRNIIISAMKQSLKAYEPELNPVKDFEEFLAGSHKGKLMIAHCFSDMKRSRIADIYKKGEDAVIMIGPEGDFSREEVARAMSNNFTHIHLGSSRLRTETAGVSACHSIYIVNQ